jgi:outer membrane receptor protein involved in Fe transport
MKNFLNCRILFIGVLILLTFQLILAGTTGKVSGIVTDAENGNRLPGVNIILEGTLIGTSTGENGYYAILNIEPGEYTLVASMIGYETVMVQNVIVKIDLTTTINIQLQTKVLGMEEVVVVAQRPLVAKDIAHSQLNVEAKTIEAMPVSDITEVIGLQAGVQGLTIRGGDARQTAFIVDGIVMNDERSNIPYTAVSLNNVKEVQVQTGGFSAEYGNIRSGVINVVTVDASRDQYSGAVSFEYRPPASKHFGPSIFDPYTYFTRPFMDDAVCWSGTKNGNWDAYTQKQYLVFEGWDAVALLTLQDNDPSNDLTPTGVQRLWEWQHRRQGDIKKPDYVGDFSFGGPVPVLGSKLGDLRFHVSYRNLRDMFIFPLTRDSYDENLTRLKLISDINPDMKLTLTGMYGEVYSSSPYQWTVVPTGSILRSRYQIADYVGPYRGASIYVPGWYSPAEIYRTIIGAKFNHVLSTKTFYEVSLQQNINRYHTYQMALRDTTHQYEVVPGYYVDEAPYGYWGYGVNSIDGMRIGGWMNLGRDNSVISSTALRFNFVSQLNSSNQIKTGLEFVYDLQKINAGTENPGMDTWNRDQIYDVDPYRFGAYFEDKLEYEGFIANLGFRLDYSNPNTPYYILDYYDPYYKVGKGKTIEDTAPQEKAKAEWALSPRLSVSHPITENSKLYFNYGHARSEPEPTYRFRIQREYNGSVTSIGNPNLGMEKTISYELGYSHNFFDQFLLNLAAYYKNITSQIGWIGYQNINGSVNYSISANNNYEDIRGLELTLDKRFGDWVTGFINYTYMVNTYGYFGVTQFYEDPNKQRDFLRTNPYQERPQPRPYARANFDLHSPLRFGPAVKGIYPIGGWNLNFIATWNAGAYATYNPNYIPGVINNVRWKDTYNFDLRITKTLRIKKVEVRLFADISNLLNTKFLNYAGFSDTYDYLDYMASLNFDWEEGEEKGNDRIGEYRDWDVSYDPLELNPNNDPEIKARNDKRKETKSYIDMPNLTYFTFLYPREIKFGIKIVF